ncbi:UNVERIFIED_CONTAM: chitin deacetylase [Siphonaria sp. JEL0065]|nr:chitin deacetylase [Siphonaria sp. JEL0065]
MSNNEFAWAPKAWERAKGVPVWTEYFKEAVPAPAVPKDDIRNCTIQDPKVWGATFDDGPSQYTPDLLHFFQQINMHTTFYVVGSVAIKYPDIMRDTYKAGHEVGIHTWSHPRLTNLTDDEIVAELVYSAKAIHQVLGVVPKYFRPPFGGSDDRVRRVATTMGLTSVGYIDTEDWKYWNDAAKIRPIVTGHFKDWISQSKTGYISLQHDVWKIEVDAAKESMNMLVKAGYTIKPIFECLGQSSAYGNTILERFFTSGQFENKTTLISPPSPPSDNKPAFVVVPNGVSNATVVTTVTADARAFRVFWDLFLLAVLMAFL